MGEGKGRIADLVVLSELLSNSCGDLDTRLTTMTAHIGHLVLGNVAVAAISVAALPALSYASPFFWASVTLRALAIGVVLLCVGSIAVSLVAGMRLRSLRGVATWNPGGSLDSMAAAADEAVVLRRCIDEQREVVRKGSEVADNAFHLLVIADGLFMGAMLAAVVAMVLGFVLSIINDLAICRY